MANSGDELSKIARFAVQKANEDAKVTDDSKIVDPNSNNNSENQKAILIARNFASSACPTFLESSISSDDDRLVKVGRAIEDMLQASSADCDANTKVSNLEASLSLLVEECTALASGTIKVSFYSYTLSSHSQYICIYISYKLLLCT